MAEIVVVGSINMDLVNRVSRHAAPGETIHSMETSYSPGGKGANQAVAAARAGASVTILGAVGNDVFGKELQLSLSRYGVSTDWVMEKNGSSGLAFITVDSKGENNIIVSSGANGKLQVNDIESAASLVERADILLVQNEIPWYATLFAMKMAHQRGTKVFFNPAPAFQVPTEVFPLINLMILNEIEARIITGFPVETAKDAELATQHLITQGVEAVVVTLGSHGSVYCRRDGREIVTPAFAVQPLDTTAAGDTFVGALAAFYNEATSVETALRFASAAAAIGVTRSGAQMSIPIRREIEDFLGNNQSA